MKQCAFDDADFMTMDDLMKDSQYIYDNLPNMREQANTTPVPLDPRLEQQYEAAATYKTTSEAMPEWANTVARRRDYFRDVVFAIKIVNDFQYWKFIYAVQSPVYVAVSQLERTVHHSEVQSVDSSNWAAINMARVRYQFRCNFASHSSAADIAHIDVDNIYVIRDAFFTGGTTIQSAESLIPFRIFLLRVPEPKQPSRNSDENPRDRKPGGTIIDDIPWLKKTMKEFDFWKEVTKQPKSAKKKVDAVGSESDLSDLDDETMEVALDELHDARADLLSSCPLDAFEDFRITVLGGRWLRLHRNKAFDAVLAKCRGEAAADFCIRRGEHRSCRFTVSLGLPTCGVLARSWCHKMQHFYSWELGVDEGVDAHLSPAIVQEYEEPQELRDLSASTADAEVLRRIHDIRTLFM
jgi:hypothetical protein